MKKIILILVMVGSLFFSCTKETEPEPTITTEVSMTETLIIVGLYEGDRLSRARVLAQSEIYGLVTLHANMWYTTKGTLREVSDTVMLYLLSQEEGYSFDMTMTKYMYESGSSSLRVTKVDIGTGGE